jgi:proteic killer suppression protein
VIRTFRNRETHKFWETGKSRRISPQIRKVAQRKLQILDVAKLLEDLLSPPGNRLERLRGERIGQHSIRINDQFPICFAWRDGDAYEVEITDYH